MNADPLLMPFAALLNRNLHRSTRGEQLVRHLEGRALGIAVTGTPLALVLRARDGALHLERGGTADATITGSPLGLLVLATPRGEDRLRGDGLRIDGDAEVAQSFRELLIELRPDLEEELSRYLGDALAHTLGRSARQAISFATRTAGTLRANVAEYLTEESHDVPTRDEVAAFVAEVDRLRDATERLAARIALVEQRGRTRQ